MALIRWLPKEKLKEVVAKWARTYSVYGPVEDGGEVAFRRVSTEDDLCLDRLQADYPAKALFFPQQERMFRWRGGAELEPVIEVEDRVIVGLRPCDVHGFRLLDPVFDAQEYRDPYWVARKEHTRLVVIGCNEPASTCFCTSVGGGPFERKGADLFLVDVGEGYVVEVLSEWGEELADGWQVAEAEVIDRVAGVEARALARMGEPLPVEGIRDRLYDLFDSRYWEEVAGTCLGCGVCTFLCPTCHCFDIVDERRRGERVRNWDTCSFRIYSQEASGHNPRPTVLQRTRQRVMHKYAYYPDNVGAIGCVGCGRCVRFCPVNIDIREMIRRAQSYALEVG